MSLHDVNYQHWTGSHHGIWRRRWVIASNGLRSCLGNKLARHLVLVAWIIAFIEIAILFVIGQLLVEDSLLYKLVNQLGGQQRDFIDGLVSWIIGHPEISVRTTYNILFCFFATNLRLFAMISVALVIPHLITWDLSSRAIIVYSSKAISRFDYFLGKFGTVFGLLSLMWLGPVLTAWFAGNLLASDWTFFWHSRGALLNTLLYVVTAMTILSIVSLGISALSSRPRAATSYWIIFWLVGNAIRTIGEHTKPWLRHFSISYDLDQISLKIFNLDDEIHLAQDNIPLFGALLADFMRGTFFRWLEVPELSGAVAALAVMVTGAIIIMHQRVKPE
ncbi:MAG: hypothetical protein M2R45_05223 [Verrucomicrobia subdivision 3 bacterium]|nr:hypothetical protein [Limisphaerales bacterium]MCS1417457.1 hypothetical protein [Limisphaerales bacterium]